MKEIEVPEFENIRLFLYLTKLGLFEMNTMKQMTSRFRGVDFGGNRTDVNPGIHGRVLARSRKAP